MQRSVVCENLGRYETLMAEKLKLETPMPPKSMPSWQLAGSRQMVRVVLPA